MEVRIVAGRELRCAVTGTEPTYAIIPLEQVAAFVAESPGMSH